MQSNAGYETIEVEATTDPLLSSHRPHLGPEATTSRKLGAYDAGYHRKESTRPLSAGNPGFSHRDSLLSTPWNPSNDPHHQHHVTLADGGGMTTVDHLQLTAPHRKASSVASGSILRGSVKSTTTMNSAYAGMSF